ncbi:MULTISPECIES: dihydroneopterin aldolase [Pseudoalteromonas]|uniref:7,8-dihydroneopterin aldolase n=1 Tax=Pseudoalteromonas amylolytica TaxID=1859457 RepID=A0A1S1MTS5_9GAMM|nr:MULTISPECIES: dihydroneopterin aldolase [Pseudoalteromonas]MCF6435890.1 dihydroneopterin aldolase [Pseudoalteromonas sp. MMG022]OHU89259.1 dihydroneopterin aldolase [Pseudoalteromonas sp. JW3]OHU92159.1 dihydroneopterin aldolase [Pseudoalteromonas amylolytica]
MDKVYISQLHVETIIGVYDFEKESKQSLYFDIEMLTDISAAAQSDDINFALDYAKVSERVIEHATAKPVELLETLLEQLAAIILAEFNTQQVTIKVSKPAAVPAAKTVGVEITRVKS